MFGLDPPPDPAKIIKVHFFSVMEKYVCCVWRRVYVFFVFPFLEPLQPDPPKSGTFLPNQQLAPLQPTNITNIALFGLHPQHPLFPPFPNKRTLHSQNNRTFKTQNIRTLHPRHNPTSPAPRPNIPHASPHLMPAPDLAAARPARPNPMPNHQQIPIPTQYHY